MPFSRIALAIGRARPSLAMEAWDVDPRAVRLARRNARQNDLPLDAQKVLDRAARDGSDATWTGTIPAGSGYWTGTNPLLPLWGSVKTWYLTSGSQIRPVAPPALPAPAPDLTDLVIRMDGVGVRRGETLGDFLDAVGERDAGGEHGGERGQVRGPALVCCHARRGIALNVFDRVEPLTRRDEQILAGDVALEIDECLAVRGGHVRQTRRRHRGHAGDGKGARAATPGG